MRKFLIGGVILLFPLGTLFLISGILGKMHKHKLAAEKIANLPAFSFITLNNNTFNSSDVTKGPIMVVRFHPECEHCQYEISEIFKSVIPSSGIKILMISSAHRDSVTRFLDQFNYKKYNSVIPLVDPSDNFGEVFGNTLVPSCYIYNKELKLVKVLTGEVRIENILKYLNGFE